MASGGRVLGVRTEVRPSLLCNFMKIGDICSNIRDKEGLETLRTLLGKSLNLGLIERRRANRPKVLPPTVYRCFQLLEIILKFFAKIYFFAKNFKEW